MDSLSLEVLPTPNEGWMERAKQVIRRMSANPISNGSMMEHDFDGVACIASKTVKFFMEAVSSGVTANGIFNNRNASENARLGFELLVGLARESHDLTFELTWEAFNALMHQFLGNSEQSNQKFKLCLDQARSLKHERTAFIYLLYTVSLLSQQNFEEALAISLEAEEFFSQMEIPEEMRIEINQQMCWLEYAQISIFFSTI